MSTSNLAETVVPEIIYSPYDLGTFSLSRFFGNIPRENGIGHACGMIPGASYIITGLPGCGKTTFCFGFLENISNLTDSRAVFVSCEMTRISLRVMFGKKNIMVSEERDVDGIIELLRESDIVVIDSLQMLTRDGAQLSPKEQAAAVEEMIDVCHESYCSMLLICQVTKGGDFAGVSGLKHIVDALFTLRRPDPKRHERIIVPDKHRYGSSGWSEAKRIVMSDGILSLDDWEH